MSNNQDRIWEYYQNENPASFEGSFARINYLIKKIPKRSVCLNIGVGVGNFEQLALKKGILINSLDPSESSIDKLKKHMGADAKVGYSQDIPFDAATFDYVVMSEVLEHLSDEVLELTLQEVKRVLKPNGKFIGTVPSNETLENNRVVSPSDGHVFHRWGHLQSFSGRRLKNLLSDQFSTVLVSEKKFINWKTLNWKGKVIMSTHIFAKRLGLSGSGRNLYFEASGT